MTTCSSFIDQLIRFEMMEAFVSTIQTVISLDSPFEPERKCFSKITRIYNLAHKLLRLRSVQDDGERHSFHYHPACTEISLASLVEPVEFFSCLTQSRITPHTRAG